MRILVFQHIACEHPGIFRDFMRAEGISWDTVELDEGAPIPPREGYDALIVMGGPMDVWQEDRFPWLGVEKAVIREWVAERGAPFLGICLGHQLLASALGGEVRPAALPEVGVLEIELTEFGRESPILRGLPGRMRCLQWHGAEVVREPQGARVLASSDRCRINAMSVGARAFGLQYHVELTPTTVRDWGAIPEYAEALDASLGADALNRLEAASSAAMPEFSAVARRVFENFLSVCRA